MLTSYYEGYMLIAMLCAFYCMLVNLYNLCRYITQGPRTRRGLRQVTRQVRYFRNYAENLDRGKRKYGKTRSGLNYRDFRVYRSTRRKLRHSSYLRVLDSAFDRFMWNSGADMSPKLQALINKALLANMNRMRRASDPARGLAINLGIRSGLQSTEFSRFLLACLGRSPLYLRINALRGVAAQEDEQLMLTALSKISEQERDYGTKLLTDVLMQYSGDRDALLNAMWKSLDRYSLNLSCAFVTLLTNQAVAGFAGRMLALMQSEYRAKDLRIAAVKYFGAVFYPPAEEPLGALLGLEEWEYGAVAARILMNYPCKISEPALVRALSSRNWHVRYNSAMTLVARCPAQAEMALNSKDRYARDIVRYARDINGGNAS